MSSPVRTGARPQSGACGQPAELLAGFAALIHRYTARADIDLRIAIDAPGQPPGQFANLPVSLADDPTAAALLTRAEVALASCRLAASLGSAERIEFAWRNENGNEGSVPVADSSPISVGWSRSAGSFTLIHHAALSPQTPAELMAGHLARLVESISAQPSCPVSRLAMLSPQERSTILEQWSGPVFDPALAGDELLHEIFEAQADTHGASVALDCAGERMTYAELEAKSNQLARYLRAAGVGRETFVAIRLPRSNDVYVAMLAVLKAGAAYVPIDSDCPADRAGYILADCKAHTLITLSGLAEGLDVIPPSPVGSLKGKGSGEFQSLHSPPDGSINVVRLDFHWDDIAAQPRDRLTRSQTGGSPDDACYVIYTSGSTGRPKGVLITHRSACNLVRAEQRIYGVRPDDRVFQGFSVAFDASIEEIWSAFAAGATLVVGTLEMVHAGAALADILTAANVTVWSTVPTLLSMLTPPTRVSHISPPPSGEGQGEGTSTLPTVRLLILGGESCPPSLVERWAEPVNSPPPPGEGRGEGNSAVPGPARRRMLNTYGPTEATVIATFGDCVAGQGGPVTIGRPAPNYRVYLLDSAMQPVPVGVSGEIHIGGPGVARGYIGQPDLTTAKFVDNPFCDSSLGVAGLSGIAGNALTGTLPADVLVVTPLGVSCSSLSSNNREDTLPEDSLSSSRRPGVPASPRPRHFPRLYKTGDLGRFLPDGQIEFVGRIDGQVKLRGYRIELSEIEAVLTQCPAIRAAAVVVHESTPAGETLAVQQLVGFVVAAVGQTIDEEAVKAFLRPRLPAYMIPSRIEPLADLPRLSSGKVDRKALARLADSAMPATAGSPGEDFDGPRTETERRIAAAWESLFLPRRIGRSDDFFADLGGHSLLAAQAVSRLRREAAFAALSVQDVYSFPTVAQLASELDVRRAAAEAAPTGVAGAAPHPSASGRLPVSPARHRWCTVGQMIGLYFIVGLFSLQWLAPFLTYSWVSDATLGNQPVPIAVLAALVAVLAVYPMMLLAGIAIKWIVIGRFKAGRYPLWGWYFLRWWFVNKILSIVPSDSLEGTPLLAWYYRLMGAHIGANCDLDADAVNTFDLVSIGADTSIGPEASLGGFTIENGELVLGPITVGRRCYVGGRSMLRPNSRMEDGARLGELSLLTEGSRISSGQMWAGSPARPVPGGTDAETRRRGDAEKGLKDEVPASSLARPSVARRFLFGLLYAVAILILPAFYLAALFPGIIAMNWAQQEFGGYRYIALAPLVAVSFIVLLCLEIAAMKWLLVGRVKPGTYPVYGWFYLRKWFVDQLMDMSLDLLGPLYATLYLTPWYRLLGARLGHSAEISTAVGTSPDLLSIGSGSFIADSVSLGMPVVENNHITLERTAVGRRAFVGNCAAVPCGSVIGNDTLIGCLSIPPGGGQAKRPGTSWLGSPPIFLPQRQTSAAFSAQTTFKPTPWLYIQRLLFEFLRVTLPLTAFVAFTCLLIMAVTEIGNALVPAAALLAFPLVCGGCGGAAALLVIAFKWLLIGRYQPGEHPLWSRFVWRTELVTSMHDNLADPFLLHMLSGTPLVCPYFRLMGSRIGRRVYMDTTDLTEFDLIRIGDEAVLNDECTIQTHLFEDRVMKMSTVEIGPRCEIGSGAIVLYDTRMEAGSCLGDLSLLMKGEVLPAGTRWVGTPARSAGGIAVKLPLLMGVSKGREERISGAFPPPPPGASKGRGEGISAARFVLAADQFDPNATGPHVWIMDLAANGNGWSAGDPVRRRQATHDCVRRIIGRHLGLPGEKVTIQADPAGGLMLADSAVSSRLIFNIAHSENLLAVGVWAGDGSPGRIGVDIEVLTDKLNLTDASLGSDGDGSVPHGCLADAEREHLKSLSPGDRPAAFLRLWTAKEAFVKALGLGVSFGLDQVQFAPAADGAVRLVRVNGSADLAAGWMIEHRDMAVGGAQAVAAVAFGPAKQGNHR